MQTLAKQRGAEPNMNLMVPRRFKRIAPMSPNSPTNHLRKDGIWLVGVVYESGMGNRYQISVNELVPFAGTLFKLLSRLDTMEIEAQKELGLGENARGQLMGKNGISTDNQASPKVSREMGRSLL
jgi:hypothetical protein